MSNVHIIIYTLMHLPWETHLDDQDQSCLYKKTIFRTNDYISGVIRQDDFQSGNHKDKSSQSEIIKKKKTSKRSVFQDPSFIRSLCKVVGALGFSCITLFTYAPKSFKSYFVLNILKLNDFMFSTKTLCQIFFKLV